MQAAACCEGPARDAAPRPAMLQPPTRCMTMETEGVTLGGQYSLIQLAWESIRFGVAFVSARQLPGDALNADTANSTTPDFVHSSDQADGEHVGVNETVTCHLCCFECVRSRHGSCTDSGIAGEFQKLVHTALHKPLGSKSDSQRGLVFWELLANPFIREGMEAGDLAELLSPWIFLSSLANACTFFYCGFVLMKGEVAVSRDTTLAFACAAFLQWLTLVQYLRHHAHLYIVMRTLARGTPALLQFLLGVVPIFVASTVFACSMFGVNTIRFDGLIRSAITLFAVSARAVATCKRGCARGSSCT